MTPDVSKFVNRALVIDNFEFQFYNIESNNTFDCERNMGVYMLIHSFIVTKCPPISTRVAISGPKCIMRQSKAKALIDQIKHCSYQEIFQNSDFLEPNLER